MSGTSRDGIDAALIRTDGEGEVDPVAFVSMPYDYSFRSRLAEAGLKAMAMAKPGPDPLIDAVAGELTSAHEIGREHVGTTVTNAHSGSRLRVERKKKEECKRE